MSLAPRLRYKLVFLGNESVGKTAIIRRYISDEFEEFDAVFVMI